MLERDEYIRRWRQTQRAIWWGYALPLLPFTWGALGLLVVSQPSGRFGAACWFLWASLLLLQLASVVAVLFAGYRVSDAATRPLTWGDSYVEPWFVESKR